MIVTGYSPCQQCGCTRRYASASGVIGSCVDCQKARNEMRRVSPPVPEREPVNVCKCGLLLDHPFAQPTHDGRCKWCVLEAHDLGYRDLNPVTLMDYDAFVPEYV